MRLPLLDQQLMAAQDVMKSREALREAIERYETLVTGKKRGRAPSMRQLSDLAIGPSSSSRQRKKRKVKEAEVVAPEIVVATPRLNVAQGRVLEIIEKNNGRASLSDMRNYPGVSSKNLSRLLANMTEKGLITGTYGGKFRIGPQAPNGAN